MYACERLCILTHLQLDVQLSNRASERTQIGQDVFTEVGDKSSGMDIFLEERKREERKWVSH